MKLRWTRPALDDLRDAATFIARDSPRSADAVVERCFAAGEALAEYPRRGREHVETGARLLPVRRTSLILVYEIGPGEIVVLQVRHMARSPYGSKPED